MRVRSGAFVLVGMLWGCVWSSAAAPQKTGCRSAVLEGELSAGEAFHKPLGAGLKVYFQPIHSGWILRVLPLDAPPGEHDYAELATPPYQSVSPLSISTDFSFRAQDAVGWNPRRFRFATSAEDFERLEKAWRAFEQAGATPPAPLQVELSGEVGLASEGTLTILDARLVPGTADQWRMAAAVASHFTTTAHTLLQEPDGRTSPLGRLVWVHFRLSLELPAGFVADRLWRVSPRACSK